MRAVAALILLIVSAVATAADGQALLFAFFRDNGQDGVYLATSTDGFLCLIGWEDVSDRLKMPAGARHGTAFRAPKVIVDRLR